VILEIALAGVTLLVVAGLTWVGRLLHICNLDALALTEKLAFPEPASALEWPELRVQSVVPPPGELSPVILRVGWPAHPELAATLLVALDHDEQRALSLLSAWSAAGNSVAAGRDGPQVELRRRQSLERVHAILLAEDYQTDTTR
jgi:hypothetical protein